MWQLDEKSHEGLFRTTESRKELNSSHLSGLIGGHTTQLSITSCSQEPYSKNPADQQNQQSQTAAGNAHLTRVSVHRQMGTNSQAHGPLLLPYLEWDAWGQRGQ